MQIELGKTYKTRKGKLVKIVTYKSSNVPTPYRGLFEDTGVHSWWHADGSFTAGPDCPLDLVEEVC
jgi:hypothetical protein